jgi:lipopolysaccharide assembly outer membrane protein LptD (OstA)
MYFTADRVERINLTTIVVYNGEITACEEEVPKWSFRAKKARSRPATAYAFIPLRFASSICRFCTRLCFAFIEAS